MNSISAYIALIAWPIICVASLSVFDIRKFILFTLLGGYLLLPVGAGFDLPLIPVFDKTSIPNLTALLICSAFVLGSLRFIPRNKIMLSLLVFFVTSPILTVVFNQDPVAHGVVYLRGQTGYDGISALLRSLILLTPFFFGYSFFQRAQDHQLILVALCVAGLAYALPILLEVRLSPQLNIWVYGYFPHSFAQQFRQGGFRPVVFLGHGLLVAFFVTMCLCATTAVWRASKGSLSLLVGIITFGMFVILILCKSVAALVYGIVLVPIIRFLRTRTMVRISCLLALVVFLFPLLRLADVVPTNLLVEIAETTAGTERAQSLQFRFSNEDVLLSRATERLLFGWGGGGRNRIFDAESGDSRSVTDGWWIIVFGVRGLFGYIAQFGLLTLPFLILARSYRGGKSASIPLETAAISLILAINLVDFLPNASLSPMTFLMAGALLAHAEFRENKDLQIQDAVPPRKKKNRQVVFGGSEPFDKKARARIL